MQTKKKRKKQGKEIENDDRDEINGKIKLRSREKFSSTIKRS